MAEPTNGTGKRGSPAIHHNVRAQNEAMLSAEWPAVEEKLARLYADTAALEAHRSYLRQVAMVSGVDLAKLTEVAEDLSPILAAIDEGGLPDA